MKIRYWCILLFYLPISTFAQRGSIRGSITDEHSRENLMYASITLLDGKDTSLIRGVNSEPDGSFVIRNIPYGDYFVQVFYTGYEKWLSRKITLNKENDKVDLDTIALRIPPNLLNMTEVRATKPLFEMKHGTMTMNVEADPTAAGDNVLELLKKMPSVIVDHEDQVSIEGKSGVTILIDDKPTYLSGDDLISLLKSMPTSMIDKIEVMRNPSSRYDAEGTAGIINIVTKKERRLGINGAVNASIGYSKNFKHNEGFNLNMRSGKLYLMAGYSFNHRRNSNSIRSLNQYLRGTDTVRITTNARDEELWGNHSRSQGHNFSLGGDYSINKKNSIGLFYRGNIGNNRGDGNIYNRIYTNNLLDSSSVNHSSSRSHSFNQTFNVNYKHSFDSLGKDLYIDFIYSSNSRRNRGMNDLTYFHHQSDSERTETRENVTDPSRTNVLTLKADYEHTANDRIKWAAGIKSSYVYNENSNRNYRNGAIYQNMINHFIYKENINAAYVQFSATANDNVDIRLGMRAEHTYINGLLKTTEESNTQNYFNLFPSFSISYRMPKNNNLDLFYRYSISRPGYSNLNPFVNASDPYDWYTGNPRLKPRFGHNISLNYSWKYILNVWAGYNYTIDSYANMIYTDPESNIRLSIPENIGKSHSLNMGISARIKVTKWWNMNYYVGGSYGKQTFLYREKTVEKNIFSNWFNFNQSFTFLKNYSADISGNGSLPSEGTFGRNSGRITVNAGIRGHFLNRMLTVRLTVNDIFNNGFWKSHYIYPDGSIRNTESRWESRSVWLSVSYRFGKQDIQPRNRRTGTDEELERMG